MPVTVIILSITQTHESYYAKMGSCCV